MPHVDVGLIVYNEDRNITNLLQSISKQALGNVIVDQIRVVSSGSTDKTNDIVITHSGLDSTINLTIQNEREGKTSAINEFLKGSENEIVILSGGDVIFTEEAIVNLISPFCKDKRVGMTSARPIPVDGTNTFMGSVSTLHWMLHNILKRHGETIAFKKILVDLVPIEFSADEAYIEAVINQAGFKVVHANKAIIFNKGSATIPEFLGQVRRHFAGHLFIKRKLKYTVSSMTLGGLSTVVRVLLGHIQHNPFRLSHVVGYVTLEVAGRILGMWDFYVRKETYRVWNTAESTKNLNK